jgi:hypothetical protein
MSAVSSLNVCEGPSSTGRSMGFSARSYWQVDFGVDIAVDDRRTTTNRKMKN